MFVEKMPEDEGMLFIFEQAGNYPFWMMNTLIPLDILWLDGNGTIQDIITAEPCKQNPCPTYGGTTKSLYVLEINA
jgi:uncharacterized membrane protein (UPF0127 family)